MNQDGSVTLKTEQEDRFHYCVLCRGIQMLWYENLVIMVIVRNHSTPQNHHPLPELETVVKGNEDRF